MTTKPRPLVLIILDGWGINPSETGNAIAQARTPVLDDLTDRFPHTRLQCEGSAVGLPDGIMGNSEVGHLNLGAGRVVYQDLMRINLAIEDGSFFENPALTGVMDRVRERGTALHLMGLVSDGGVHSDLPHLFALLEMARGRGLDRVCVHAILDGRDTPPDSGRGYIEQVVDRMAEIGVGRIATVCGRFHAMDRDTRWERVERAYRLYTRGEGTPAADPVSAVERAYAAGETDEFVRPSTITNADGEPVGTVGDGDGIIFFNFRADRAREITRAFTAAEFPHFDRSPRPELAGYVCMTAYDAEFDLPVAFPPVRMDGLFGGAVADAGLRQLRIAETEKYAHVTYFFNGGEETPFPDEDRCLIPSPREVETYDEKPEMSAPAVTEEILNRIASDRYDLIVLNFANMDMVGHTGVLEAAVRACETVDACVGRIVPAVLDWGGALLITADHGNAEMMIAADGGAHTAHTTNPVPCILVDPSRASARLRDGGGLGDVAPTLLALLGINPPPEMTGKPLLAESDPS